MRPRHKVILYTMLLIFFQWIQVALVAGALAGHMAEIVGVLSMWVFMGFCLANLIALAEGRG